ncbi:class IV adenylate cyclase [Candidatus Pacearchaeota archaeon CG10_big_fil_rev_8_21_14_0_10_35_219]|nr:class IV adenylate cyclase [Candidatus Pacearchaeota archaeon]OIO42668.1 MAG: hypothetical protein AUJ63_02025 [Candidatus Pacearchaeota archaeon CG1_02_35_32]PIO08309.1 MAG: class IV adenylate cyclase [Candidatus Pacearchaeota archaeon CG10_big_fil_rev_8_21_14_0_10_35_219]PIY81910.1 MAG: class IV adenylate cyclase [Candidatus Pacearchaeota archaeon CG_4_10_14_0_8_um_filter_35_169]PIZ79350.1 MAG: class IV adenylate cyclase [Candidatus Pacearchaeota archaeon CG_4_10_14_0_2_um_filter_35_33]PJ
MNEEVEIKVELKNPEEVDKKLREIAKFVKAKDQKDDYYTPAHKDFFDKKVPDEYLRVRYEDGRSELCYHYLHLAADEAVTLYKTDEYEVKIEDAEMMKTILEKLDMVHKVTVNKHRKTFDYKEFEVVLDYIEELGNYIEVELKKVEGSFEDMLQKCYGVLDEVGAEWEKIPAELRGYPIMILAKKSL